jgi:NosR/NirI family nitrous oxide reductase transcriptional regulator
MVVGGKLRIFKSLKRREECGSPCQLCAHDCPISAIKPTGEIIMDECFYCLDCQDLYNDEHKCPPLVKTGKVKARNFKPVFTPNIVG